jgi:hypothetical protein
MMLETILLMLPALPGQDFKPQHVRAVAVEIAAVTESIDEAALMLETAYEESRFRPLVGDHGRAFGVYQLQRVPRWIGLDVHLATPIALERLRMSARWCPSSPLAPYVGGCRVPAARRASARRIGFAQRMVRRALALTAAADWS